MMARTTTLRSSNAGSNTAASGMPQGTPGGIRQAVGSRRGSMMMFGQEMYLWVLVLLEVAVIGGFRKHFRRYHGG